MAILTGNTLYRYLSQKVDSDYTSFVGGTIKANRLFLDAMMSVFEERFKGIESQQYRDDINVLINTQEVYQLNNNSIYEAPLQLTFITFQANTATVGTYLPHNLNTGNSVTFSGVQTNINPNINTTFTVTVVNPNVFTIPFTYVSGVYLANSGTITTPNMIPNYWQIIQVNARYDVLYDGVSILSASADTPSVLRLGTRTDLRTTSRVFITGVNANVDGDKYLKKLNDFQFAVYNDSFLRSPVVGLAGYTSGGTISKVYYKTCKPFLPRTKISPLGQPTPDAPRWKDSEKMLQFYPIDQTCREITIDYYKRPDVLIDVSDNTIDLTSYYNEKFLLHIVDVAATLFSIPARDEVLFQQEMAVSQKNN